MGDVMTRPELGGGRPILVSACLLGLYCRYDGRMETDERVAALAGRHVLIPVCPEQLGGLPTPREAVELLGGRAVSRGGADVTEAFERGVAQVERIAGLRRGNALLQRARHVHQPAHRGGRHAGQAPARPRPAAPHARRAGPGLKALFFSRRKTILCG